MTVGSIVVACLPVAKFPKAWLRTGQYERSICDYCGTAVCLPLRGGVLVAAHAAIRGCTSCIAAHLRVSLEDVILDLGDRGKNNAPI